MQELIIIFSIIFVICGILIFLISKNNNVKEVNYKVVVSFDEIKENLEKEFDTIDRLINIIEREIKKENKTFNEFKFVRSNKLSEFELDNFLSEVADLIFVIKKDNSKLSKVKSFDGLITELKEIESKLIAIRTYYNKYVGEYNNIINKKSYKIIALIKKYKSKRFFEGKELVEEITI